MRRLRLNALNDAFFGGLGDMTSIPTWSWRILFILALLLHGMGLVLYVLLWIFVPLQSEVVPPTVKVESS